MLGIGTLKIAIFVSLGRDFSVLSGELGLIKFPGYVLSICENTDNFCCLLFNFYVADCVFFIFSLYPRFCQIFFNPELDSVLL